MDINKIELGDRVKDKISGYTGIVVSKCYYLYGCIRYQVVEQKRPKEEKESIMAEGYFIDEPQLELLEKDPLFIVRKKEEIEKPEKLRHGIRTNITRNLKTSSR